MRTVHPARSLAASLALLATLFGGLFYGAGNMLMLATVPGFASVLHGDPGDHRHDHASGPRVDRLACGEGVGAAAVPPTASADHEPLGIPAHCMFCLDGVSPAPVDLAAAAVEPERPLISHLRCEPAPAAAAPVYDPRQSRGPPLRLV